MKQISEAEWWNTLSETDDSDVVWFEATDIEPEGWYVFYDEGDDDGLHDVILPLNWWVLP